MKIKKQFFITAIFVIIGLVVSNATVSINSTSSIDKDEEIVSVLIYLKDQVNLDAINDQMDNKRASLQNRHETTVVSLQNIAYETQPSLVEYLNDLQSQEIVEEYKSFWIRNIIRVDTYQSVVDQIAKRDDVLEVYPNYEIELIDPIDESPEVKSGDRA